MIQRKTAQLARVATAYQFGAKGNDMFSKLLQLAHAEAWVAAGREVVDGTLAGSVDDAAMCGAQAFVDERREGLQPRQAIRLLEVYLDGFLDAVEAFQEA